MNTLTNLFSSKVRAEVLRLLFGPAGDELHIREIARRAGLNDATVRQELKQLTSLGIIGSRRDGNRVYYSADVRHPLYTDLRNLVLKTSGLADVLRDSLQHSEIQIVFVFGSIAAGTSNALSDIDLMVIGEISLRQLSKLLSSAVKELGREINPHILTVNEYSKRVERQDHFLTTVLKGPKLFVIGDEHELAGMGR